MSIPFHGLHKIKPCALNLAPHVKLLFLGDIVSEGLFNIIKNLRTPPRSSSSPSSSSLNKSVSARMFDFERAFWLGRCVRSFVLREWEREHLYDALLGKKKTGILKIHTSCQVRHRLRPTAARLSSKFDFYLFEAGDCSCHTNKSKEKLSSCSPSDKSLFF